MAADLFAIASRCHLDRTGPLSIFAALLSNLVSNVPAVLVFKTFIPHLAHPARAWIGLAMSSTLAGNLTLQGSVANLIVVQRARAEVTNCFGEYARAGVPLTILSLAAGVWMLN